MRTYYIYRAINKVNRKSYIGKTVDFHTRVWQHKRCYEKEDCKFHDAIKKYGADNFEWEILDTTEDECKANSLEWYYIEKYDSHRNGYNMNNGGVGGHNARPVVCLTLDGKFVKRYDSAMSAESIDNFCNSDVLLSCKFPQRTCKNHIFMFENDYIKYGAREYLKPESSNMKSIIQCDIDGNFVNKFKSVNEAAKITGACRTTISRVLTGHYKTAKGYIFVYEENFPIKDLTVYKKKKKGRMIAQIDNETGQVLKVFDRISDAGRYLNVNYKGIQKVLDQENRTAYGYKWKSIS